MRKTIILATGALVIAVVAVWGSTVITANHPQKTAPAEPASTSKGVMELMRNAKDLPVQQFDAH
jgi:hypothetical protein